MMKRFNHIYSRLFIAIISLMASSVAMGQGLNEANIPIQNVTAWEQHKVDGHALSNLKDGKEETTWSSYRDGFAVLEYMHVKNPDATANGRRHWVELPYIPNQNTEIEITFKANTTSGGLKQNIFGFGYPPFGHGMSLNIGGDGKIVYGTSNHIHTLAAQADNNKHTIICSATSVTIDGGVNLMPGTLPSDDANPSAADIIQDGYTSQHNLCLFSNPGEDQKWARCFDGDIYSVKIRENGKLLYDLVPAKGWWGRPGFYDRISTNVYTFFDMVDYVKNDVVTDGDPALHIHYKIPYEMGSETTTGYTWTDNLVTNGDFKTNNISSYAFVQNAWLPKIFTNTDKRDTNWWNTSDGTPNPTRAIQVINSGIQQTTPQDWDCQFRVVLDEGKQMIANGSYTITFWCKADKQAKIATQFQTSTGGYYNYVPVPDGGITVGTTWKKVALSGTMPQPNTSGDVCKQIGFLLNVLKEQNTYYFSNIEVKYNESVINSNGDLSDVNNLTSFGEVRDAWTDQIQTVDGKKCIQVINDGNNGTDIWNCQFRMNLSESMKEGDKYYLSYSIKAKNEADIDGQIQQAGGGYYGDLSRIHATTSWQKIVQTGTIGNHDGSVGAMALMLNTNKTANTYYITDIDIRKGTPVGDVPNTEVEITYKNTFAGASEKVKIDASWGTPAANGTWNSGSNIYTWTGSTNNLATVFKTPDGQLAKCTALHLTTADYVTDGRYRICFMNNSELKAKIVFYSAGQKDLVFADREETKDLDLSTITHIAFGGESNTGSITVTNMYLDGTKEDTQSARYLFSYNTREDKVLSLSIKDEKYQYTSGGVEGTINFNPKNQIITTKFRPMEFEQDGVPFGITGSPTWNTPVNYLYLFGTHSTSDTYARSFIGEIYGAVIREGGQVKVELQPAWKNGVYGFYDRRSNTFYTKDEDDDNLCGKSANFRGVTGHDAQAPVDHAEGIPQVGSVYPYTLTIDLANPKIVKNFYMTTAADKIGNYTNNSPARWTLYGSSGDNQWTELYKYEQTVPKFSELNADGNTEYYLYNVETGRFYVGSNEWETRASLSADKAFRFKVTDNGNGKYSLQDFVTRSDINDWKYVFVNTEGNLWSDYNNNADVDYQNWEITHKGNNQYELSNSTFQDGAKVGTSTSSNIDNNNRLYLSTDAKNTTWAFISAADYNAYQAAKSLTKGDPMLNGKEYKYAINAENAEYKQFRLVIDQMVANNNQINLADIAFTSYFDFEHYVGRVYDNMGTPPDNLAINGSSGYKQAYKMKGNVPDDPRLNEGVTIQRTHEYEHEIYLMPGQTVDLTPFSDFGSTEWRAYNYQEQYIRWYNYRTDLRSERLRFDKRDGLKVSTLNKGDFAWNLRDDKRRTREGALTHYTADTNPVVDENGVIDVIAIEAGGIFDWNDANWNGVAYVVKEPTLMWRHTFVIKDAKTRSDEMFANKTANDNYIKSHKIKLMCPAGTPFQYPLPSYEDKNVNATRPTNYFYRVNNGDVENPNYSYEPVYHYSIETVKDGVRLGATNVSFKSVAPEGVGKEDQMAVSFKDLDGLNRVLYIQKPQVGTYTISIHAMNKLCTGGARDDRMGADTPLLLMQYELEVLPPADGVMITETELNSNSDYEHQRPANMNAAFGKPTTEVNFDDVRPEDLTSYSNDGVSGGYLKWPWQWEYSSYGFGYENRGDYNMYMITDIGGLTPFHGEGDRFRYIYDRKYYDNGNDVNKRGYFLYANAASDPSRMSVLNIGKDFCPNTKVFVSAWINEFQGQDLYAETANVIFSFRGVKADGTETVLNSFVTGYVTGGWNTPTGYKPKTRENDKDVINHVDETNNPDNRGKWMHVYYTFTTGEEAAGFDHYIITLENNCTSSEGADYAIDDIRAYVLRPNLQARLMEPVCNGESGSKIEIYGNFEQLQTAFNFSEDNQDLTLKYCFLDKAIFDANYDGTSVTATNAFNASLKKGVYGGGPDATYGTLTLNTTFNNNISYANYENNTAADYGSYYKGHYQQAAGSLVFPCKATDVMIQPGKAYILAVARGIDGDYDIGGKCSKTSEFTIPNPLTVKIDGQVQAAQGGDSYCANQRPEVMIDLNGVRMGGEPVTQELLKFDWYYGPCGTEGSTELDASLVEQGYTRSYWTEKKGDLELNEVLGYFRDKNPNADNEKVLGVSEDNNNGLTVESPLTSAMLLYLKELVEEGRLTLYKDKAFATANLFGENLDPAKQKYFYMTAIPINPRSVVLAEHPDYLDVKFCVDPINVSIKINELTPKMKDGAEQVTYPETISDVPLRIGLKQLKRTVIENIESTSASQQLWVPLRSITPVTEEGHSAGTTLIKDTNDKIYLVDTNDPWADDPEKSGALVSADPIGAKLDITSKLVVIGKVMGIIAVKNGGSNVCQLAFLKNFKFREGYWYTVKFHFKQQDASANVCPGDLIFTIKVVPGYQMWTGEVSRNWNDDRNWKRVTKGDLLWTNAKDDTFLAANADYITDGGTNDNMGSYAPADFTKVIIPAGVARVPYMYDMRTGNPSLTYAGALSGGLQIANGDPTDYTTIGKPTENIIYDMASIDRSDNDVACRPWYDHTCDQIHFNAGAILMDQRYLYYNKAWCDIDVPVGTWQTVASPLVNIVAGDLYLPTATARQQTPLFENINYDTELNDRFKPAVFQHSWNKSMAKVYELGVNDARNVGVKLDWSHVYNDVNVQYGAGQGFSIKVDVSAMDGDKPAVARFRLPKADKQYTYYSPGNTDGDKRTEAVNSSDIVNGVRPGRLADLSGTFAQAVGDNNNDATATNYFLVGNPLICYLDMQEFFAANTQFESKYWIATAEGQRTALFTEEGWASTTEQDPKYLAPGVSFFVKMKEGDATNSGTATTQTPLFTADMMSYTQGEVPSQNPAKTRAAHTDIPQLRLTAEDKNGRKSIALLTDGAVVEHDMVETLFDSNLKDDIFLYTTKGGQAQSIASIVPGDTLPLVTAGLVDDVVLHINGAADFETPLYVIDSEEGTMEPLTDDITLKCTTRGVRYYITSPAGQEESAEINTPRVTASKGLITIYAPTGAEIDRADIYAASGATVDKTEHIASSYSVALPPAIYIVRLVVQDRVYTYKLLLTDK